MEDKNTNALYCSHCGALIEDDDYTEINGEIVCSDCIDHHTTTCDCCGSRIWISDEYGDEYTSLCHHCFTTYYARCSSCNCLIHQDEIYHLDGESYCRECYDEERSNSNLNIHNYSYKPEPLFYGNSKRFFGVELEIDSAGKNDDYAEELLNIGNINGEHIYIKGDGSLDDGMEIVSHPMSLDYHKNYRWADIMRKAISLGYRSHQTSTCGLHIHVNRDCLGDNRDEQEEVISRILYFVEHHWNEMLKFSRRSEYSMNRWAARYGYEKTGREILDKAKKGNNGRYAAVNLCNYSTIEFRMFRGTLKINTFMATLELVNAIIEIALNNTEDELHKLSWSEFVAGLEEPELIAYLKERKLYINEDINSEEDF